MDRETKIDVIKQWEQDLRDLDSLAPTPFSELFHVARTSSRQPWRSVTVRARVRNGELETSDPIRTRQGEHLQSSSAWDIKIGLPVSPFMETRTARQELLRALKHWRRHCAEQQRRAAEDERVKAMADKH